VTKSLATRYACGGRPAFFFKKENTKTQKQFEMRTHKRVLTVFNAHPTTVEKFATYVEMHMPPGMAMRVVRYTFHQLPTSIRIAGAPPAAT